MKRQRVIMRDNNSNNNNDESNNNEERTPLLAAENEDENEEITEKLFAKEVRTSTETLFLCAIVLLAFLVIGTFWFSLVESCSFLDSLYFSTSVITTVGLFYFKCLF